MKDASDSVPFRARLGALMRLARMSNSPTIMCNVIAGAALGGWFVDPQLLQLSGALMLLYWGGMMMNDLFDYRIDCKERPDRPLPSGLLSTRTVALVSTILIAVGVILIWQICFAIEARVASVALVIAITVYNLWHKGSAWSSLVMGICRVLVYAIAFYATNLFHAHLVIPMLTVLAYIAGVTLIARGEVSGHSARWPILLLLLPAVSPWLLAWIGQPWQVDELPILQTLIAVSLFVSWVLWCCRDVLRGRAPRMERMIPGLLAGICLLDASIVAQVVVIDAPEVRAGVGLCGVLFLITLFWQRKVKGG